MVIAAIVLIVLHFENSLLSAIISSMSLSNIELLLLGEMQRIAFSPIVIVGVCVSMFLVNVYVFVYVCVCMPHWWISGKQL